ncbi:hypothetical protein Tco_1088859 [Tanacetum coccineum]
MPLGDHAAHWANYLGKLVRELPLHYPSWRQMSPERKAGVVAKIGTQFDLRPHMESDRWPQIYAGIQQHLQKIYNGKKAALKERYWVPEEDGTYDLERLRRGRPSHISEVNWDAQLAFWNDPKNLARAAQNKQNRAKSKVMETSATREYPSLIHTFFLTHTVGGVFLNPEDKALYDEMLRGLPGSDRLEVFSIPSSDANQTRSQKREPENGGGERMPENNLPPVALNCLRLKTGVGPAMFARKESHSRAIFRSTYPGRHVARERYPQRQVARDTPDLSLGNIANVVVTVLVNNIYKSPITKCR